MSENLKYIPPQVAFNTASAYPTEAGEVLSTKLGTRALGRNVVDLRNTLGTTFGVENVSASVMAGRKVDVSELGRYLSENGVRVHSVDVPNVKHLPIAIAQAAGNVLRGRVDRAQGHMGWALTNVESPRQQRERTAQGLEIATEGDAKKVVKAHAEFWRDSRQGGLLIKELERVGAPVALAVEIDAPAQTQAEYFEFIDRLRDSTRGSSVEPRIDFDTGGLARSTHFHPDSSNQDVIAVMKDVLKDKRRAGVVEIVSFSQYVPGTPEAHAHMTAEGGVINFPRVAELMGAGVLEGVLSPGVPILLETDPRHRGWYAEKEGKEFAGGVLVSFNRGAKNASEHPPLAAAS